MFHVMQLTTSQHDQQFNVLAALVCVNTHYDAWKEGMLKFPITLNYCGVMCSHMLFDLLQYDAFRDGACECRYNYN